MRYALTGLILILAVLFWLAGSAAAPAQRGQPGPAATPSARGSISGTTLPSDSIQPLSYVTLKLIPLDDPAPTPPSVTARGGNISTRNLQTSSGAYGVFDFSGILPGRYAISADREGYQHFETGPGHPDSSILTVANGQKIEGVVVAMIPVPGITGTVFSPYSQRLAGASVSAYRVEFTPYGRRVVRTATVLTHEGGEYRLFNLTPAYYYVSASYGDRSLKPWKSLLEISPNLTKPDDGYSTIYFPAEMRIADARAIHISNSEVANIDIAFKESNYFNLSINLILPPAQNPPHPLQNLKIALFPAGSDLGTAQDYVIQAIKGSGTRFSVDRLAEGDYVVVALADFRDAAGNLYSGIVSDTRPIHLIENIEVTIGTMYPIEIPGSVARPSGTALPGSMQIQLMRIDSLASQTITANVDSFGRFNLLNAGPGIYDVYLKGMPANAYLQDSAFVPTDRRLLQIKVDDTVPPRTWRCGVDCPPPHLVSDFPLIASIGANGGSISGNVVDAQGKKVASAEVVLVPSDPAARLRRDRYAISYTDTAGAFGVQGLPPGLYNVYAFEALDSDIYFDPDFNLQISPLARPVMLGAGSNRPLDPALRVISRDDLARYVR
jgi:hypothetical protein